MLTPNHHFTTPPKVSNTYNHTQLLRSQPRFLPQEKPPRKSQISMATSICATGLSSSFHGSWGKSIAGEDYPMLAKTVAAGTGNVRIPRPVRSQPMMGNVNEGKGVFAPLVVATRNIIGKKRFNQLRGKAIALHSQVITEFCKTIGADSKQRQGLIRLAKKNGEKLGFLA